MVFALIMWIAVEEMTHPVTIGVVLGLFVGKQLGVFTFAWLAVKMDLVKLPGNVNWSLIYGVSLPCVFLLSITFTASAMNSHIIA